MTARSHRGFAVELLGLAAAGDLEAACDLVVERTATDDLDEILSTLASVQSDVGDLWAANELSIPDEHRATAVVDAALAVVERLVPARPEPRGRVMVVCAETEWHTLPARLAAAWLRLGGWKVDFLGGSLPAASLAADLERRRPEVVAVSCSVPDRLFGARRTIAAATASGIPVVAGGAAFGRTDLRALRLGAAAWAAGGADIARAADRARSAGVAPSPDPRLELRGLEVIAHQERMLSSSIATLQRRADDGGAPGAPVSPDDLRSIIRYGAASLLVDDDTLFTGFLGWFVRISDARGASTAAVRAAVEAVSAADPPEPLRPVLLAGIAHLTGR